MTQKSLDPTMSQTNGNSHLNRKTRYAQVGLGGRHAMFRDAVVGDFSEQCEMVAMCDLNEGRLNLSIDQVAERTGQRIPGYLAEDFDRMIGETKPDCVIVTSRDSTHDGYICRAMELGCDVITEKPMTIDEVRCQRIIDTQKATGHKVTVTFNYRYSPPQRWRYRGFHGDRKNATAFYRQGT